MLDLNNFSISPRGGSVAEERDLRVLDIEFVMKVLRDFERRFVLVATKHRGKVCNHQLDAFDCRKRVYPDYGLCCRWRVTFHHLGK